MGLLMTTLQLYIEVKLVYALHAYGTRVGQIFMFFCDRNATRLSMVFAK